MHIMIPADTYRFQFCVDKLETGLMERKQKGITLNAEMAVCKRNLHDALKKLETLERSSLIDSVATSDRSIVTSENMFRYISQTVGVQREIRNIQTIIRHMKEKCESLEKKKIIMEHKMQHVWRQMSRFHAHREHVNSCRMQTARRHSAAADEELQEFQTMRGYPDGT